MRRGRRTLVARHVQRQPRRGARAAGGDARLSAHADGACAQVLSKLPRALEARQARVASTAEARTAPRALARALRRSPRAPPTPAQLLRLMPPVLSELEQSLESAVQRCAARAARVLVAALTRVRPAAPAAVTACSYCPPSTLVSAPCASRSWRAHQRARIARRSRVEQLSSLRRTAQCTSSAVHGDSGQPVADCLARHEAGSAQQQPNCC